MDRHTPKEGCYRDQEIKDSAQEGKEKMSQNQLHEKKSGMKTIIALTLAVLCMMIALLWLQKSDGVTSVIPENMEGEKQETGISQEKTRNAGEVETDMDQEALRQGLEEAAKAAVTARPVEGTVTDRPGFVADIEWRVLQNVSRVQKGNSDRNLRNYVNKLLFAKKQQALSDNAVDPSQRRDLARQIIGMIPSQVDEGLLDPQEARKVENELESELAVKED